MAIPYLLPEILTNIFTRLPIETLSNVILVNKWCLKLISTPAFARAHLKHSKQGNFSNYRFIFESSSTGLVLKQFSFDSLLFNCTSINVVDLDCPEPGRGKVHFESSCDGLVCFEKEDMDVFLWNPCTGKYKKLPRLSVSVGVDINEKRYDSVTYEVGYDESTDDYKVLALIPCGRDEMYGSVVNVFSLKRNSWKLIPPVPEFYMSYPGIGKLVSGKVHWVIIDYNDIGKEDILSFDFESEVFDKVEKPPSYGDGHFEMRLDMLEGCLCMLLSYDQPSRLDLWVMKEYGVKESWTKLVTVSCANIPKYFNYGAMMLPNGEILFGSYGSYVVYNSKNNSFRFPSISRSTSSTSQPAMYAQSLVSPVV